MSQVICHLSMSLDGYVAGPSQSTEAPLGIGGEQLHRWHIEALDDNRLEAESMTRPASFIMGRNMFGPVRGQWKDSGWTGWWGANPPYHAPVFVLTHYPRSAVEMDGGTTFHFFSGGPRPALQRALEAADGHDVGIAGGAQTARQYLEMGVVDELHVHFAPVVLGGGEPLFTAPLPHAPVPVASRASTHVTHTTYRFSKESS